MNPATIIVTLLFINILFFTFLYSQQEHQIITLKKDIMSYINKKNTTNNNHPNVKLIHYISTEIEKLESKLFCIEKNDLLEYWNNNDIKKSKIIELKQKQIELLLEIINENK